MVEFARAGATSRTGLAPATGRVSQGGSGVQKVISITHILATSYLRFIQSINMLKIAAMHACNQKLGDPNGSRPEMAKHKQQQMV